MSDRKVRALIFAVLHPIAFLRGRRRRRLTFAEMRERGLLDDFEARSRAALARYDEEDR